MEQHERTSARLKGDLDGIVDGAVPPIGLAVELVGPELMEEVLRDIRETYKGVLYLAKDGMRIDL